MKSSELSNGGNRIALRQLCKTGNYVIYDVIFKMEIAKKMAQENFSIVRSTT